MIRFIRYIHASSWFIWQDTPRCKMILPPHRCDPKRVWLQKTFEKILRQTSSHNLFVFVPSSAHIHLPGLIEPVILISKINYKDCQSKKSVRQCWAREVMLRESWEEKPKIVRRGEFFFCCQPSRHLKLFPPPFPEPPGRARSRPSSPSSVGPFFLGREEIGKQTKIYHERQIGNERQVAMWGVREEWSKISNF